MHTFTYLSMYDYDNDEYYRKDDYNDGDNFRTSPPVIILINSRSIEFLNLPFSFNDYQTTLKKHKSDFDILNHSQYCSKCRTIFRLRTSLGRWECHYHPGICGLKGVISSGNNGGATMNDGNWACCGKQRWNPHQHDTYEKKSITGCKHADHLIGGVSTYENSNAYTSIPLAVYLSLKYERNTPPLASIHSVIFNKPIEAERIQYLWDYSINNIDDEDDNVDNNNNNNNIASLSSLIVTLPERFQQVLSLTCIDLSKSIVKIKSVE